MKESVSRSVVSRLFLTPWTVVHQAPLSRCMRYSKDLLRGSHDFMKRLLNVGDKTMLKTVTALLT